MRWLWIVPTVVALVGFGVLVGLARRAVEELEGLRADVARLGELRPNVDPQLANIRRLAAVTTARARALGTDRSRALGSGGLKD